MSQTDADATADSTDSTQAPDDSLTDDVTAVREQLESLTEDELSEMDDFKLVELRSELKLLEEAVETARKQQADGVLKDRIEVGEKLYGLSHIQSHSPYVAEDEQAVIMRAVSKGINFHEFVDINASQLRDEYPELAEIGEAEYTYLR